MNTPISFNVEGLPNIVNYKFEGQILQGRVLEGEIEEEGLILYRNSFDGNDTIDPKEARNLFTFSYRWRGVWEGRVYFQDDEYWGFELKQLSDLWTLIEDHCKMVIRSKFPADYYDD